MTVFEISALARLFALSALPARSALSVLRAASAPIQVWNLLRLMPLSCSDSAFAPGPAIARERPLSERWLRVPMPCRAPKQLSRIKKQRTTL